MKYLIIKNHAMGKNTATNGKPIFSQSIKTISGESGNISFIVLTNKRFGGVPTRVPVPPILAEYAIESISAVPNVASFAPRVCSLWIMARPIGSIINVVELLEVHIDKNAVAIIKLKMICRLLVPINSMVKRAIRLCKLFDSIALATKKAPRISNTI